MKKMSIGFLFAFLQSVAMGGTAMNDFAGMGGLSMELRLTRGASSRETKKG